MVVAGPPNEPGQKPVSYEAELLTALQASIADLGVASVQGQGAANRFRVNGWELSPAQQFQYGDLRIELAATTLVVEAESAGGVTNLVKYWPLLRSGTLAKRLVPLAADTAVAVSSARVVRWQANPDRRATRPEDRKRRGRAHAPPRSR
jgi:hypothetical protein